MTIEVKFENHGTQLTGVVRRPAGGGPHPAVAFVDGSGPAERDSFDEEAEVLARAGFAGLAWDKPGCGGSGGDWRDQSLQDRAAEALAAVACLAGRRASTRAASPCSGPARAAGSARWPPPCRPPWPP
jgi:dipeptidyl aminopeptidase/acylaminoacyl peptidase